MAQGELVPWAQGSALHRGTNPASAHMLAHARLVLRVLSKGQILQHCNFSAKFRKGSYDQRLLRNDHASKQAQAFLSALT